MKKIKVKTDSFKEERICNKCNEAFKPSSRYSFFCKKCKISNNSAKISVYEENVFRRDISNLNKVNFFHGDSHIDPEKRKQ